MPGIIQTAKDANPGEHQSQPFSDRTIESMHERKQAHKMCKVGLSAAEEKLILCALESRKLELLW